MEIQNSEALMPSVEGFSKAFLDLRAQANLSRAQLAVFADIGIGSLERVEQCKQPPSLRTLICVAEVFDIQIDEIIQMAHAAS